MLVCIDEFEYETGVEEFCRWMLQKHLNRPINLSEKKKEYPAELKINKAVENALTLEEIMYMYRDSIAGKMMDSIRKDNE